MLYTMEDGAIKVHHSAGVFSCYTVRLEAILEYFNTFKRPPAVVDSSAQFAKYKERHHGDVSGEFFNQDDAIRIPEYTHPIKTTQGQHEQQFSDYSKLNFKDILPFVARFFAPSKLLSERVHKIHYQFPTLADDFCGVMYRGGDKKIETIQPSYQEFIDKVATLKSKHQNLKFLIQTDEPCLYAIAERTLGHRDCFIVPINAPSKLAYECNYVANMMALAKCKHLVTTSGNGEFWLRLFRGNNDNSIQWLSPKEYIYGVKNESYDPNQRNFWLEL